MSPVKSDRAQRIMAAIEKPGAKSDMGKHPIIIGGQKKMFDVFKIPTNLLAFNIRNGRFAAELRAKEKKLGRRLDPLLGEDEAIIRELLLNLDPSATKLLKDDLRKVGQTEPGIITHDGFVINGNRRMAILQELHRENPSGKYEYLEVQILESGIGEKDLWRIEAGLQLSRDKRLEYGPVNDLLKIREGLKSKLTPQEIAATLYGVKDAEEVLEKDRRLTLIDNYLEYIGEPENYTKATGFVEHFINLQDLLKYLKDKDVKGPERQKWLLGAFEMIRAGMKHMDIRDLRRIAGSDSARTHFVSSIKSKPGSRPADEDQKRGEETKDTFRTAKDYYDNEEDARKPELLLKKATRAIEVLVKHKEGLAARKALHSQVASLAQMIQELVDRCGKKATSRKRK